MDGKKCIFWVVGLFLVLTTDAIGQRSELTRKNQQVKQYSQVKFKKNKKMRVICPIFQVSEYPYQGIGLKIGDPIAITYKFYATKNFAVGVDVGRASSGLYRDLHQDRFNEDPQYQDSIFVAYNVLNQNVFSAKVFYYMQGPPALEGMDIYVGAGFQMQFADVEYDYLAIFDGPRGTRNSGNTTFSFQPLGPEVTLGLEYAYFKIPVTAFVEGGIFFNIEEAQQWRKFQGGLGLRYVF